MKETRKCHSISLWFDRSHALFFDSVVFAMTTEFDVSFYSASQKPETESVATC